MSIFNKREIYTSPEDAFVFSLKSIDQIKNDCLFVFDANVLLLPFTTDGKSLDDIKTIYTALVGEDRLFLPAQAVREYLDNRSTKLTDLHKLVSDKSSHNFPYLCPHPLLSGMDEYSELERFENEIKEIVKQYKRQLKKTLSAITDWGWNDPVSKMYHEVLSDRVLDDQHLDLTAVEADLKRRHLHKIPPGYKDNSKAENQAGDLLIWNEILHLGAERQKDIVFISGDAKADWWHKSNKKTIYPRFELVDEFREKTQGKSFHILSLSQLLRTLDAPEDVISAIASSEQENKQKDAQAELEAKTSVKGSTVSDEYAKLINPPEGHMLLETSSNWKQKSGWDTDTYVIVELDSYGNPIAQYEVKDSTKMHPPFNREIYHRSVPLKI
ncbi:PIN-like domain-containing protein [Vibrio cyclitrophicus]|uniref:PIN-like domain-containing protein n=1 Tax=Vibrio cyclitrophicus TaxID=47951 RepID=UPI0035A7216F